MNILPLEALVTTDGSITDIPREDYIQAEERVVNEFKSFKQTFYYSF